MQSQAVLSVPFSWKVFAASKVTLVVGTLDPLSAKRLKNALTVSTGREGDEFMNSDLWN